MGMVGDRSQETGEGMAMGLRRQRGDAPARRGGIRQIAFARCLPAVTPAPKYKSGDA